jgi:hypothetical protein
MTSEAHVVMGREVRLPLRIREAEAFFACYLVPTANVHPFISGAGLEEAHLLPGFTLCTIVAVKYVDGDLGPYQEVAIVFYVRQPNVASRGRRFDWFEFLRRTVGTYVYQLPVTEEFAMETGIRVWGFPKWIATISVQFGRHSSRCALYSGESHVLTLSVKHRLWSRFRDREVVTYTRKNGDLYRVPWLVGGKRFGMRLGGASLTVGAHPIGESLKTLGMPKRALVSGRASGIHSTFYPPERCA